MNHQRRRHAHAIGTQPLAHASPEECAQHTLLAAEGPFTAVHANPPLLREPIRSNGYSPIRDEKAGRAKTACACVYSAWRRQFEQRRPFRGQTQAP